MLAALLMAGAADAAPLPGGASSLVETYDDWSVVCQMQANAPACVVRQVQTNNQTKQVALTAELTRTPEGKLKGILLMPLGLSLPEGAQLKLDDTALGSALPFSICIPQGCIVPLSFEADTIAKLKAAKALNVVVMSGGPATASNFRLPLKGLSAATGRVAELVK